MKLGKTVLTHPDACPFCGKLNDAATAVFGKHAQPKPGDVAVCVGCASIIIYDENIRLRRPTIRELRTFAKDDRVTVARVAVRRMLRKPKRGK